jgi:glycosyltransferase involved in cell wall biosynthesis
MVANSCLVKRRIEQIYGRKSIVIHPPVEIESFPVSREKDDYFIVASRLVPYKRVDLVVEAFSQMPHRRLIVLGDGPEMRRLRSQAGSNVTFEGHVSRSALIDKIRHARAFVFAACEDFGISMAEAQAAGTPVISYSRGGARDIVIPLEEPNPTGVFFHVQSADAIIEAVNQFCENERQIDFDACHRNALRFSTGVFDRKFRALIQWTMDHRGSRDNWPKELEEGSTDETPLKHSQTSVATASIL